MKYGYLRSDSNGHDYLVPEEEIISFEDWMEYGYKYDDWKPFNDKYGKYRLGESYQNIRIVIEE